MALNIVKVPDIGEGIAQVEVVAWHVQAGDEVAEEQVLADIMTDKATVEIPSPVSGTVIALHAREGDTVAVGSDLIHIETAAAAAGQQQARRQPEAPGADAGRRGGPAHAAVQSVSSGAGGGKALASPSVRQHARQAGIDLAEVRGSGPEGRILHADLDAWQAGQGKRHPADASGPAGIDGVAAQDGTALPLAGVRRRMARKMQEALRHVPQFSYVEEVDVTELEALRARLNAKWEDDRGRLTVSAFILRAMAQAVRDYPLVNARYDDQAEIITHYSSVHAGVAVHAAEGLLVPVLRNVESHDLWFCAREIARMAGEARAGKARLADQGGSTITLTNLGRLGGIVSTPMVNCPEVAIVGVNRIVERPAVLGGAIVARKCMNLSSSFDHRVIDGAYAAGFIQAVRGYLECPATLFVE